MLDFKNPGMNLTKSKHGPKSKSNTPIAHIEKRERNGLAAAHIKQ